LKTVRALALAAFVLAACSNSSAGIPVPSPSPAASKAADLRTRLDLLLDEHVMLVAKQAEAAFAHSDEYTGYATLLTDNGRSLAAVVGMGFGNTAATQFASVWAVQNGDLIDYTIGLVTHNTDKSSAAWSGLLNAFVPQFAQSVTGLTKLPLDQMMQLEARHVIATKAVIDDLIAQAFPRMYADLHTTYADSPHLGDALASRMAQMFPDKFPGDPSDKSVDIRASINGLLQEHAYLVTMYSDGLIGGRGTDAAAASNAVAANAGAIEHALSGFNGPRLNQLWNMRDADLMSYASSADPLARQWLTDTFGAQFAALTQGQAGIVRDQVLATLKVIDEQRAGSLASVAADDRAAAAAMQAVADPIA
jgi:hypothetical protein